MARGDELLATIEAIHSAGLDTALWPKALQSSARIVGGNAASIELFDKGTLRHIDMHSFGLPPAEEMAYVEHYAACNVRLPFVSRQKLGEMNWDYLILDEQAMVRSPFYAEFMPRMDVRYFVGGIIEQTDRTFAGFCVHRSAKQGHVDRAGIAMMERLIPHVRQAFDVARRLKGAGEARTSLEHALDWLADGVAFLAADGRVVYANESLRAIARQHDGIGIRKDMLDLATADMRARLDAAVGSVARLRDGQPEASSTADFHVPRKSSAPPYLVSVRPLLDRKHSESAPAVIVFVRDLTSHNVTALRMLRDMFGLTEAEAALAQALHGGMSLADYAKADAVSLNTVYTHLRRIKEKTGCHRMAELIRKLNDLQIPLRIDR